VQFDDANRAIRSADDLAARRRADAVRLPSLVRAIDILLFDLEELNLAGVARVPARIREQAGNVLRLVPAPVLDEDLLRVRFRTNALMDTLFTAQELLFRAMDPSRPALREDDDEMRSA